MFPDQRKLLIIDGNALIHRAFHAIPHLTNSAGIPTNAVYGFASMILNLLLKMHPQYIVMTYDLKGKTFRDDIYTEYKATRAAAPQELYDQIPQIKKLVQAFNIPEFAVEGFEADDVIATIVKKMNDPKSADYAEYKDVHSYVVTGDRDTFQLISPTVSVITPHKGFNEIIIYTPEKVKEEFGITPEQFCDYKTLRGDTSDNIPGVPGIGEKTATDLLQKFQTIDGIYANLDKISPAVAKKLTTGIASMEMSRQLVCLTSTVDIDFDLNKCTMHDFNVHEVMDMFQALEFRSLIKKLTDLNSKYDESRKADVNGTLPLVFD